MNFLDRLSRKKRSTKLETGGNELRNKFRISAEVQTFISFQPYQRVGIEPRETKKIEMKNEKRSFSESTSCSLKSLKKGERIRLKGASLQCITPVNFLPDFSPGKSESMSRKSLVEIRRSERLSKFINYSPSRKNIMSKNRA